MQARDPRYADRSERAKLRVSGPQRAWFLHQILTQAFEDAEPGAAREAAMITVHGRMIGHMEALVTDDAILCHFEPEIRHALPEAMRRYVLATQVELADVTDDMGLVLVVGPRWREIGTRAAPTARAHPTGALGTAAGYLWMERPGLGDALRSLESEGLEPITEEELEAIRISNGVPRWGKEMDEKTFPQEAGIDERAIHYHKGCYVGQEAMAKIHFRGKVNRRIARLEADEQLHAGSDVLQDDRKVGTVTSASDGTALAMIRHTVESGSDVRAGDVPARVVG